VTRRTKRANTTIAPRADPQQSISIFGQGVDAVEAERVGIFRIVFVIEFEQFSRRWFEIARAIMY